MPDYQGIGLGTKFLNCIAERYKRLGFQFTIVTSAKNMINALNHSDKWIMTRYSASKCSSVKSAIDYIRSSIRSNYKTGGGTDSDDKKVCFIYSFNENEQ